MPDRNLGNLEGAVEGIKSTLDRVLDSHETMRREESEARRRIHERLELHNKEDRECFNKFTEAIQSLTHALNKQELMWETAMDTIDGHGRAIVELERESSEHKVIAKVNKRWINGLLAIVVALVGALFGEHAGSLVKGIFGK